MKLDFTQMNENTILFPGVPQGGAKCSGQVLDIRSYDTRNF